MVGLLLIVGLRFATKLDLQVVDYLIQCLIPFLQHFLLSVTFILALKCVRQAPAPLFNCSRLAPVHVPKDQLQRH